MSTVSFSMNQAKNITHNNKNRTSSATQIDFVAVWVKRALASVKELWRACILSAAGCRNRTTPAADDRDAARCIEIIMRRRTQATFAWEKICCGCSPCARHAAFIHTNTPQSWPFSCRGLEPRTSSQRPNSGISCASRFFDRYSSSNQARSGCYEEEENQC